MTTTGLDPEAVRLGATIRGFRKAHGLTIAELARACGISRPYMNNIERGEKKATLPICRDVARTLSVPIAAITVVDYERISEPA